MGTPDLALQAQKQTIQNLPDVDKDSGIVSGFFAYTQRGPILPTWGTRERELELRRLYRYDFLWMVQGAFAGVGKRQASTPWEIKGPDKLSGKMAAYWHTRAKANRFATPGKDRSDIEYWQELLRQADFGRGWGSHQKKSTIDYLRQDAGAFWEIIAPGKPTKAPTGPATGLAYLDSIRCIPTGDPEYPVIYYDRMNKMHVMHHTRVVQLVDMPDGDERRPGYGLCALSRAISIAMREVLMGRYIEQKLDDKPEPGMMVASGMTKGERDRAAGVYMQEQGNDERPVWGRTMWFYSADPANPATLTPVAFSNPPEKFSYKEYTELDINAMALALGVDVQDLWQLTSSGLGSGAQSEILTQKSRGKTIGDLLTETERAINDILPEEYTFEFKRRDAQEETEKATNASAWAGVASKAGSYMSPEEIRTMMANQVEAVKDAMTDEQGQIRRLGDLDPEGKPVQTASDVSALAAANNAIMVAQQTQPPPTTADDKKKDYQATVLDFEGEFADLVASGLKGDLDRRRFGTVARALLRRHGLQAMKDGLRDGGIEVDTLDDGDMSTFALWLAKQSGYVTDFANRMYKTDTQMTADARAEAWGNKSLREIYHAGVVSADANSMREWVYGDTDHCEDCQRLNGQKHRLRDWAARGWLPGADKLECNGFACACTLPKVKGRARGNY